MYNLQAISDKANNNTGKLLCYKNDPEKILDTKELL